MYCFNLAVMLRSLHIALLSAGILLASTSGLAAAPDAGIVTDIDTEFAAAVSNLATGGFADKEQAAARLVELGHPRAIAVLQAMLNGELYTAAADRTVIGLVEGDGFRLFDAVSGDGLGTARKDDIRKITLNNRLRVYLRGAIARLSIADDDPAVRLNAVREMTRDLDEGTLALMRDAMTREDSEQVLEQMRTALALVDVQSPDRQVRLDAIARLGNSLVPEARGRLTEILRTGEDGQWLEPDAGIRRAVEQAIGRIDANVRYYKVIENIFFGISLGSVLLLVAIGLAITFGVMGVINMAHGELMMIGAYTTYVVQLLMPGYIDYSLFVAVPLAFAVAGLFGIAIERGVIRFLYGRPLETLLATFGISLILQQLVRTVFSPLNRSVSTPSWMSGSLEINAALSLTWNRLYIIAFSLMVFFALMLILKKTSLGLKVRAVAQNRAMARAMGVRSQWIDALTFGLGSGIAGVAGVALSQLTNVGPNLGQSYIIDSFLVVVFGGVGNLWGTLVAALTLGVVNKFLEPWTGAVLAKILVLVFIILFSQKRPRGLFPQRGRAAEH